VSWNFSFWGVVVNINHGSASGLRVLVPLV
jgi:hypothetical protein